MVVSSFERRLAKSAPTAKMTNTFSTTRHHEAQNAFRSMTRPTISSITQEVF